MTAGKSYDAKVIQITAGAVKNNYINVKSAMNIIPSDCIATTRPHKSSIKIAIEFPNGTTSNTDIDGSSNNRCILRIRTEVKKFFEEFDVKSGDYIVLIRLSERKYRVQKLSFC